MKDYIYVLNENNEQVKMEIVLVFKMKEFEEKYILYKDENDNSIIYLAKLKKDTNELETNLTDKEKEMANEVLKQYLKELINE